MNNSYNIIVKKIKDLKERGAFHIVLGSFITKFVSFFGSIFIVRLLTKADYGILSYYENFASYFVILSGFGLDAALLRFVVLADNPGAKRSCYTYALRRGSIWNAFLIVCGTLILYIYPHPSAFERYKSIGLFLIMCMPFVFAENASLSTLRGLFKNKIYAIISFVVACSMIVARIIGAAIGGLNLTVRLRLCSEIICGLLCVKYMLKRCFPRMPKDERISSKFAKEMDHYALQMMVTNSLWAIFMLNDLFLLGQISGDETIIADYKVAYVIPANLSILVAAVGVFVAPYFTRHENNGDYKWIQQKLPKVLIITSAIMGIAILACLSLTKPIVLIMYGEEYLSAIPIMRILLIASFFNNGIRATFANILSATGHQKDNLYVAGFGIIAQIGMDLLLIPSYGGKGVAISSTIVYLFMSMGLGIAVYNTFYRHHEQQK